MELNEALQAWRALEESQLSVRITEELFEEAAKSFERHGVVYLHHVVAVAVEAFGTLQAARKALRRGLVLVDGQPARHNQVAEKGSLLCARLGSVDQWPLELVGQLTKWNRRSERPEASCALDCRGIYLVASEPAFGWAVVNKPPGMHCQRCGGLVTLEDYLPAVVPPPTAGTHCRGPRVCHRLDFRVAGPVLVATSEEAMRRLKTAFEERRVQKEYRAIVCGSLGVGSCMEVCSPVGGEEALSKLEVLREVPCPHYGRLSEVKLLPVTGRHHQLRQHCVDLGLPIVNEERSLFEAAAGAWQGRTGAPLPCYHVRGGGNLFLQAVALSFEGRRVEVPLSSRFDRLLKTSSRAFEEGWRSKADGSTFREPA